MLDDATAGESAPELRCMWCSAVLPSAHETTCPSCGATLVGEGESAVPGLTAIDADAIRGVNDSFFGLQTGVFTNDLAHAWAAFNGLEVGGVIVNDVPTYRIDHMPYGGVKDSGLGREGLRYAIDDMTEIRIMVLAQPA